MRPSLHAPLAWLAAGMLLQLAAPPASQALQEYTATGSSISGSRGGVSFTDANWRLRALGEEALVSFTSIPAGPQGSFNLYSLPLAPRVTIETLAMVLEADLLPSANFRWLALSGTFPVGLTPKIGFVYTTPSFNPETAAGVVGVPGSFVDLKSPYSVSGPSIFEPYTFATSEGDLVISASSTVAGTFRISPVPTPLPALAVAGAFSWSRRLRARRARRAAVGCP